MRTIQAAMAALAVVCLYGQTMPSFDVASVKHDPWTGNGRVGVMVRGNTLTAGHTCLYGLIEFAYNLRPDHLSGGPSWAQCGVLASSDLYQVIAKGPGDTPPPMDQFRAMLRALLADRFQLQVHHAEKVLPVYYLVVGEHGPKMKESAADAPFGFRIDASLNHGRSVRMMATHLGLDRLLPQVEGYAGKPVLDHTGLKGFYDFTLEFDVEATASVAPDAAGSELFGQSFVSALQKQLGLKLEAATAPFDTVVIDHAEKPTEN